MADQPAPTFVLRDWEPLYVAAVLESDNTLLGDRIRKVEKELKSRLSVLTDRSGSHSRTKSSSRYSSRIGGP